MTLFFSRTIFALQAKGALCSKCVNLVPFFIPVQMPPPEEKEEEEEEEEIVEVVVSQDDEEDDGRFSGGEDLLFSGSLA